MWPSITIISSRQCRSFDPLIYLRSALLKVAIAGKTAGRSVPTNPLPDLPNTDLYGVSGREGAARSSTSTSYCKAFGSIAKKLRHHGTESATCPSGTVREIAEYCLRDVRDRPTLSDLERTPSRDQVILARRGLRPTEISRQIETRGSSASPRSGKPLPVLDRKIWNRPRNYKTVPLTYQTHVCHRL